MANGIGAALNYGRPRLGIFYILTSGPAMITVKGKAHWNLRAHVNFPGIPLACYSKSGLAYPTSARSAMAWQPSLPHLYLPLP